MEDLSNLSESGLDASKQSNSSSSGSSNRSLRVAENIRKKGSTEDRYQRSLKYLSEVQPGTVVRGNDALQRNLGAVEAVALSKGLSPDAVSIVLEFALSLRTGGSTCSQVLKFLIPATVVPQEAVVRGVSWLCVGKMPMSAQVLFVRWILTVFDLIDCKDHLRAIYGFIFSFITEENLCPYICHLLYLLTMREHVQPYRVRKLLEVQAKMGRQPYISQLLALYKVFRPELVTLSVPSKMKVGFKNHNSTWKKLLSAVQKKNMANPQADHSLSLSLTEKPTSRKRKLHHLQTPPLSAAFHSSSTNRKSCRLEQLSSFPQLLENIDSIELPAQMGALLGSSLGLHYLDCVRDESAFLRLNFWLGHALHEEFLFGSTDGGSESSAEASRFLSMILSTQHFLQEGFSSTERFLLKFLTLWDGSLHRPQILELLSDISPVPSSCIKTLLFDPLMQLYFTSSVFYKCSVIECLNSMLVKWLTWHAVCAPEEGLDISLNSTSAKSMSLSGFMDSVAELVRFVGRLATVGLQLENCHALLLNHALDFYETVCDMFLKYDLPLFIIPPAGVFYPALLATDSVTVDRLGFIMYRYRKNLTLAKTQQQKKTFHISRSTYNDFNRHLVAMVSCLWNSKAFVPEMGLVVGEELLAECQVAERWSCFDLVHHPAFVSHAVEFHQKCWPERPAVDLNSIKAGKYWGWYLEFLFNQGFHGLREFAHINTNQRSSTLRNQCDERPLSQA